MLLGTLLCFEETLSLLGEWAIPTRPFRLIGATLALYTIVLCAMLGLEGRAGAFRTQNGLLLKKIGSVLRVDVRQ